MISHETFADAPHKTFFVDVVPQEHAQNADYIARRTTEQRLEEVRTAAFPSKPSRRMALFLNRNVADARKWLRRPARRGYRIYKLRPLEEEVSCEANYIWYNYCVRLHKDPIAENKRIFAKDLASEIAQCLEAYWSNAATEPFGAPSLTEVLYLGTAEVAGIVA